MGFPSPLLSKFIFCGAALCVSCAVFAQRTPPQKSVLCCEDENGRPVCGDVLPTACYGRAYREMSPSGTVLRHVAAPLSPDEVTKRRAEALRQKEANEKALVQRRLDRVLMEMYSSLEEIDLSEKRALAALEKDLEDMRSHELELRKREATLQHEKQLYSDSELPAKLTQELASVTQEREAYRKLITAKESERAAMRERYIQDRKRFAELTRDE